MPAQARGGDEVKQVQVKAKPPRREQEEPSMEYHDPDIRRAKSALRRVKKTR